jgi:hypothetical protein
MTILADPRQVEPVELPADNAELHAGRCRGCAVLEIGRAALQGDAA